MACPYLYYDFLLLLFLLLSFLLPSAEKEEDWRLLTLGLSGRPERCGGGEQKKSREKTNRNRRCFISDGRRD